MWFIRLERVSWVKNGTYVSFLKATTLCGKETAYVHKFPIPWIRRQGIEIFELDKSVGKYGLRFSKIDCHYDARFSVHRISSAGAAVDVSTGRCPLDPRRSLLSYPCSALEANLARGSLQVKDVFCSPPCTRTQRLSKDTLWNSVAS
jgi:hypothetical protein